MPNVKLFDLNIAKEVGTDAATVLQELLEWQFYSKANNRNKEDIVITISLDELKSSFFYLSDKQLKKAISRLKRMKFIDCNLDDKEFSLYKIRY